MHQPLLQNLPRSWTVISCMGPAALMVAVCLAASPAAAQIPTATIGQSVPRDVRDMYTKGLQYLAKTQASDGSWQGGQQGPGVTGLCLMAFLASGEDPNFGIYSGVVRKAVRDIITKQDAATGYYGASMYHHGFAMLALAEAYGSLDDRRLWERGERNQRTIAQSLELAVRCATTAQKKNSNSAWRYSPDSNDADTSVSGAILVGLLAARNAGIAVPDESIDKAISYYTKMTADNGQVAYAGGIGGFDESFARISIGTLVYALAKRKDLPQYKAALGYLTERLDADSGMSGHGYAEYTLYYQSQALFQGDVDAWEKWNKQLVRNLKGVQNADGSISSQFGAPVGTSMSLLALALNFRLLPIYER